ncbi:alpha-mannosidase 2 [Uranotaenia lowii]|uniref:alpha-mannosidase 2 n=1 Tax=Uranotaenia lowii TaxID=190385 RepID=UPI00247AE050|nr:alpha-mannosidase 2 [Uranotaenia lowii]XP_055587516.1 alpha-mannosidase 2 [Uranotaenia lowii]XP_055587517.1 alpha-mannosidase 2 [Uranotaenia lowii]
MVRIRRKFVFILTGITLFAFLVLYAILNYSIPSEKPNKHFVMLEDKIKKLENGLNRHWQEFGEIKQQIDSIRQHPDEYGGDESRRLDKVPAVAAPHLGNREMIKDSVISANRDTGGICSLRTDVVPQTDIQMLELYERMAFDNVDGGAWKQGWQVSYDETNWNSHHKLKVFVVPHSHNDPGWIYTFNDYYERQTKMIFANMLRHLDENPGMKFIWAEISYFAQWYDHLVAEDRNTVKKLIKNRQLEFVTGGWVMPDEANSHWYSMLLQLTEGQSYLKAHLNVTPTSSWSIDPFGQSATMPYILKQSGFDNLLIQRTHYIVKKNFAMKKHLEFRWRQLWDTRGETDLLTHMMPFYSYDIPHTCGPDPKVCCQFDFKRLPNFGLYCPWKIPPSPITDENVAKKAELIVDQWRKKSVLYNTRNVLIPLGDDFRYTQSREWEAQRVNYEKLFDYINNEHSLNVEARFATLQEYFDSIRSSFELDHFPSLSGDFFTYADINNDYWSGYFTSRPFHKRQDRILLNYVRSAEMLHAWNHWSSEAEEELGSRLENARRQLSLFQHHDGITGTATAHVMEDYADRMAKALEDCKFVMQQAVYRLLTKSEVYEGDPKFHYLAIDDSRTADGSDTFRPTIIIGEELPFKHVVVHNSLPYTRTELVEVYIGKPYVTVQDSRDGQTVPAQVSPVWAWHTRPDGSSSPQASTTKFRLLFKVTVPPLGLVVYTVNFRSRKQDCDGVSFAKTTILSRTPFTVNLREYPEEAEFVKHRETSLHIGEGPRAGFNANGLLKSISVDNDMVPIHLDFLKYGMRFESGKSGAYLFHPDGPATEIKLNDPVVLIMKGPLEASITTGLSFANHQTILRGDAIEIRNTIDIGSRENTEIVMRISTNIASGEYFYTDLNGMQIIKRKRFAKLPIQGNYYPVPSAMYIQDESLRLTILSGQPLGGSSLKSGQMEIMQDRRLTQDDDRGLGEGVLDNRPVLHLFRLVLESRESCTKLDPGYPAGFLTANTHRELNTLLHPMEKLIFNENQWTGLLPAFGANHEALERDMEVVAMRNLPHITSGREKKTALGLVVHRTNFEDCGSEATTEGNLNIKKLLNIGMDNEHGIYSSPLTLLRKQELVSSDDISLCPMDAKAFIIHR